MVARLDVCSLASMLARSRLVSRKSAENDRHPESHTESQHAAGGAKVGQGGSGTSGSMHVASQTQQTRAKVGLV